MAFAIGHQDHGSIGQRSGGGVAVQSSTRSGSTPALAVVPHRRRRAACPAGRDGRRRSRRHTGEAGPGRGSVQRATAAPRSEQRADGRIAPGASTRGFRRDRQRHRRAACGHPPGRARRGPAGHQGGQRREQYGVRTRRDCRGAGVGRQHRPAPRRYARGRRGPVRCGRGGGAGQRGSALRARTPRMGSRFRPRPWRCARAGSRGCPQRAPRVARARRDRP